jgi:hypothetical protein
VLAAGVSCGLHCRGVDVGGSVRSLLHSSICTGVIVYNLKINKSF